MTFRAQASFEAGAVRAKALRLIEKIKARISELGTSDSEKTLDAVNLYLGFIERLGSAEFDGRHLDPRETATFQGLNRLFGVIDDDIQALYQELKTLLDMRTVSFNRSQSALSGAEADLNRTTGIAMQATLASGGQARGLFIAVDNFADASIQDPNSTAEVAFGGGALTLEKVEVIPAVDSSAKVTVTADTSTPNVSEIKEALGIKSGDVIVNPPYEGKFYALLGEIEPEGGYLKFTKTGTEIVLAPTPDQAKINGRKAMLDGSPDSYWQIERTMLIPVDDVDASIADKYDFDTEIIIDIGTVVSATAITLDPINFGERAWLEVTNIETSEDGQSWTQIPGLFDHNFYNVLTDEANKQLNTSQANAILSPSKFSYAGKGLWIFAARNLRFAKLRLTQRTPIIQPYEVLSVTKEQQVKTTKGGLSIGPLSIKKGKTSTKTQVKTEALSYTESLQIYTGEKQPRETKGSFKSSEGIQIKGILGENIFSLGGKSVEKSGWKVLEIQPTTKLNVIRYAIGIRDLGILSVKYSPTSQYISKPFRVPSPIRQISLKADLTVPEDFGPGNWAAFYISTDDGHTWTQIAPMDLPAQYIDGKRIPTSVLVNSRTNEDARDNRFGYIEQDKAPESVLVRIDLSRPDSMDGQSPIIKRYAVELLTQETFSEISV